DPVAVVDDDAGRARVARHAGEAVVELVDDLHAAHPEVVDLLQARVDLVGRALGLPVLHAAVEQLGDLDPHHDGELARVDNAPRLRRRLDDAAPALARAAVLRVDVVLQLAEAPGLQPHAVHLVAGVLL